MLGKSSHIFSSCNFSVELQGACFFYELLFFTKKLHSFFLEKEIPKEKWLKAVSTVILFALLFSQSDFLSFVIPKDTLFSWEVMTLGFFDKGLLGIAVFLDWSHKDRDPSPNLFLKTTTSKKEYANRYRPPQQKN